MMILMVLLDCRRRVNCAQHVEPYPVPLHHSYETLAHRMPYFSVLGILKYGMGWRPQIAPFENCSI